MFICLFLFLYTLAILLYSIFLYKSSLPFYRPLSLPKDPKDPNSPKIDIHSQYKEFQCQDTLSFWRIFIGSLIFFPIRIVILIFIALCLNAQLKNAMKAKDNPETTEAGRKKVEKIVRFWATFFIRVIGIRVHQKKVAYEEIYQKYLGKDYKMDLTDKDYSLEVVLNMIKFVPGFIAKKEIASYYFIGPIARGLNCMFCDRESSQARRQIFEMLEKRQKDYSEKRTYAPLVLFPEGTTTSGRNILKFKKGAFYATLPIKPIIINIYQESPLHLAVGSSDLVFNFLRSLCYLYHDIYFIDLPVIRPTPYMYKHYADLGNEKWEVFAEVVRKMYCEIGGYEPSNKSLSDSKRYNYLMTKGCYPPEDNKKEN